MKFEEKLLFVSIGADLIFNKGKLVNKMIESWNDHFNTWKWKPRFHNTITEDELRDMAFGC